VARPADPRLPPYRLSDLPGQPRARVWRSARDVSRSRLRCPRPSGETDPGVRRRVPAGWCPAARSTRWPGRWSWAGCGGSAGP